MSHHSYDEQPDEHAEAEALCVGETDEVADCIRDVIRLDERRIGFFDDPITIESGCGDEFAADFDKEERALLCTIVRLCGAESAQHKWACDRLERWMP